jgi:hypothetical protein
MRDHGLIKLVSSHELGPAARLDPVGVWGSCKYSKTSTLVLFASTIAMQDIMSKL